MHIVVCVFYMFLSINVDAPLIGNYFLVDINSNGPTTETIDGGTIAIRRDPEIGIEIVAKGIEETAGTIRIGMIVNEIIKMIGRTAVEWRIIIDRCQRRK